MSSRSPAHPMNPRRTNELAERIVRLDREYPVEAFGDAESEFVIPGKLWAELVEIAETQLSKDRIWNRRVRQVCDGCGRSFRPGVKVRDLGGKTYHSACVPTGDGA